MRRKQRRRAQRGNEREKMWCAIVINFFLVLERSQFHLIGRRPEQIYFNTITY